MHSIRVKKGDIIFTEGSFSDMVYIITSGRFELSKVDSKGEKILIDVLGPNSIFGELGVLTGEPRTATVTAVEPGELSVLSPREFDHLLDKRPEFLRPLLRVMAKRLSEQNPLNFK
ncbi:MAG: cyclic nucleotide-binding domain-containing protein [Nitrospinae bacterium]|nr:cyclic nucleotide-binding domain-containing protein [Nitrospinota bacterium]